jgi:hypothetical protein
MATSDEDALASAFSKAIAEAIAVTELVTNGHPVQVLSEMTASSHMAADIFQVSEWAKRRLINEAKLRDTLTALATHHAPEVRRRG